MNKQDIEEGECSSDDSIAGYTPIERPTDSKPSRQTELVDDSDDDPEPQVCQTNSDSDSDNDCSASKRRSKVGLWARRDAIVPEAAGNETFKMMAAAFQAERKSKKKNNIWGSIIQEDSLNSTLSGIGVKRCLADLESDRGAEAYDYTIPHAEAAKQKLAKKREWKLKGSQEDEMEGYWGGSGDINEVATEDTMDEEQSPDKDRKQVVEGGETDERRGTKRSAKERLGKRRVAMDRFNGQKLAAPGESKQLLDIGDEDFLENSDKDFALLLAERLGEEKPELLQGLITQFGKSAANKVYKLTQKCEAKGGMEINNGARRRTSGGVFFYLLKTDSSHGIDLIQARKFLADSKKLEDRKFLEAKKRKKGRDFDREMKDFLALRKEIQEKKVDVEDKQTEEGMDEDAGKADEGIAAFSNIITSLGGEKPEVPAIDRLKSFQEPDAPPNSVERVERSLPEYEDDLFSHDIDFEL